MTMMTASNVTGYGIQATDGSIGAIEDLLFDDATWALRWVVVDTGKWLPGRRVLLPPSALVRRDEATGMLEVDVTQEQVKESPGLEADEPVSRQLERRVFGYYGWEPYWVGYPYPAGGTVAAGAAAPMPPVGVPPSGEAVTPEDEKNAELEGDPRLRSTSEVTGYYVEATDGEIGHVEDFIIEEDGWIIRYLIIDTRNWWPGKRVLIAPQWLRDISWADRRVVLDVDREKVKSSPEYEAASAVDRDFETRLFGHYGYPGYWT